jgi:hypothetical protein
LVTLTDRELDFGDDRFGDVDHVGERALTPPVPARPLERAGVAVVCPYR